MINTLISRKTIDNAVIFCKFFSQLQTFFL